MPPSDRLNRSVFLVADPSGDLVAEVLTDYPEGRSRGRDIYELPNLRMRAYRLILDTALGQPIDVLLDEYHPDRKKRGRRA